MSDLFWKHRIRILAEQSDIFNHQTAYSLYFIILGTYFIVFGMYYCMFIVLGTYCMFAFYCIVVFTFYCIVSYYYIVLLYRFCLY
jgi:hypothetical protein